MEGFPLTEDGWAAVWQALAHRYPRGIEPTLAALRLRASGERQAPGAGGGGFLNRPLSSANALAGHAGTVYAVAIAPAGTWLATVGRDKTARLWAADGGRGVILGHNSPVRAVVIAPDGT